MIENVKSFLQDEEGQSMVEYGVTLGAVAAVSYIAVVQLGDKTADLFAWMANHLPGGEDDETSQVRVIGDGLVAVEDTDGDGNAEFSSSPTNNVMNDTLGGSSVYTNALGWDS